MWFLTDPMFIEGDQKFKLGGSMRTRREFIVSASVASIGSMLPLSSRNAIASTTRVARNVSDYIRVTLSSDKAFDSEIDTYFQGIRFDPIFQKIKNHSMLIKNISIDPISALSTRWTATTPTGIFDATRFQFFHPTVKNPKTMHFGVKGNKTRFTGKIPLLKPGAVRLVSPYFNWSTKFYSKNRNTPWEFILSANESRQFFFRNLAAAANIDVRIDSIIVKHHTLVGEDNAKLSSMFRKSRNAEHDEGLAVLKLIKSDASTEQIAAILRQHSSMQTFPAKRGMYTDPIYCAARRRQAKVLLRRLKYGKHDQFVRTARFLAFQPKSKVGLGQSKAGLA